MPLADRLRFLSQVYRFGRLARKPPHVVAALRQKRLRKLLRHAAAAPFFREKYRGLDLERAELSQLPPTTKGELMAQFDRAVTDPTLRRAEVEAFLADKANLGQFFRGRYAVSHTSGSLGQPLILVQDRRCLEVLFATMAARGNTARPGLLEGLRRLCRPLRLAVVTMQRGFYPSGAAFEYFPAIVGRSVRMTRLSAMQDDVIDRLNDWQPHAIASYPSVLDWLALQPRLRLRRLRQLSATGEALAPAARRRIAQRFGVPIFDHYGLGECLFLADGCPTDGGAHVNADWAIFEVVDGDGRPVPPGQPGAKALVTNLANTVQPIIRYEVGDVVTMAEGPCRCGSPFPWIARIGGRAADVFWVGPKQEQMVAGVVFLHGVEYLHQVREWQAVQVERDRVEVRLELLPGEVLDRETAEGVLVRRLAELGMPAQVAVTVRLVASLGPDPATGKFRRMISLVDRPAAQAA